MMLKSLCIASLLVLLCMGCRNESPREQTEEEAQGQAVDKRELEQVQEQEPVVVAYLPDYRLAAPDIDQLWLEPVSDLIYFSLVIPEAGVFQTDAVNAEHLQAIKSLQHRLGARLLLCIGGWGRSDRFAEVASDALRREAMINSLATLCLTHGFDGIDYDWEHPVNQSQLEDYALLIKESASRLGEEGLLVTAALAPWQNLGPKAYDALDRVHLMSYDNSYPHATFQQAKQDVEKLITLGCPKEKISLGIPFYGRDRAGAAQTYGALAAGTTIDPERDEQQGYAFNGPATVGLKTQYALTQGLAGVMIWEIFQDDPDEQTLLRAIAEQLDTTKQSADDAE